MSPKYVCAKLDQSDHCKRVSKIFVKQHLMKHQHLRQGIHQLTPLSNVIITESMIMSIWQIQTNLQSLNFIGQDLFGKCNFHFCLSFLTINSDHDLQKWYKAQKGLSCKIWKSSSELSEEKPMLMFLPRTALPESTAALVVTPSLHTLTQCSKRSIITVTGRLSTTTWDVER